MNRSLENQTALVTGGGSGIGLAIAQALAAQGARVAILGRRAEQLEQAAATASAAAPLMPLPGDVTDRQNIAQAVARLTEQNGALSILVCAAGINIKDRSMAAMQPEQFDQVMQINATGVYNTIHAALPAMRARRSGTIINVSSIAGKRALALGGIAYCASKFAATALGTAIGSEAAADGVRITNVYPGEVDTPILQQRPTPVTDEHRARILKPDDVARLVLAICQLPPQAHVPEVVIKPLSQDFV